MKYYIISGEASGDLHGSNLMKALLSKDSDADFRFWGGDKMRQYSNNLVTHYSQMAFMGFSEVIKNLPFILNKIKFCKADILQYKPDALILIDYPGFNLRIAKFAKQHNIKVFYYISPQVWAWKSKRVYQVRDYVTEMYVILPFEKAFYKKYNIDVKYVGHPLTELIPAVATSNSESKIIALLPGSRKQEIEKNLPILCEVANKFKEFNFIIAQAPGAAIEWYDSIPKQVSNISVNKDNTYSLLAKSHAAIVTSGTATLETALFNVPQVVCYKGSYISYAIGKRLVNIKYISLVNLILDATVVTELIQTDFTLPNLINELKLIIDKGSKRNIMLDQYSNLRKILGNESASNNVAESILNCIK